MRIAVTSSDGQQVDEHFGMATQFLIYEVQGDTIELKETRTNAPWCGEEAEAKFDDDAIEKAADILSDCEAVLAGRIGECAYDDLMGNGILPFEVSGKIEGAISKYMNYRTVARGVD